MNLKDKDNSGPDLEVVLVQKKKVSSLLTKLENRLKSLFCNWNKAEKKKKKKLKLINKNNN